METDFVLSSSLGLPVQSGQSFLLKHKALQLHVEEHFTYSAISRDHEQQAKYTPRSVSM